MAEANNADLSKLTPILDDEDEATLAAIDAAIDQASRGQLIPAEDVQKLVPQWISKFSTPRAL